MKTSLDSKIGLTWTGKQQAIQAASEAHSFSLQQVKDVSSLGDKSNHVFIEGDNLDAMKALLPDYKNQVQQIYIDPPYNTGQNFIYNDQYEGHTGWLNMMLPRLMLARTLLKSNGVIFVSIDDHELAHLKLIMDEVFGEENYIDIFSWVKTATPANLSRKSKKVVEYVLCYQKEKDDQKFKGLQKQSPSSNGLLNQSNKKGILKFPANLVTTKIQDGILKAGKYGTDHYEIKLIQDTKVLHGLFIKPIIIKAKFKWTQPKLDKELSKGTIINIPTINLSPSYDKLKYGPEVPSNLIDHRVGVATNEKATRNLIELMGAKVFDFPKPVSLIKYLLGFNDEPSGIILDFFAGSAATMQAVMEMNNEDGGNRKCICIQKGELVPEHSIAAKRCYHTIADISIDRINRFIRTTHPLGHQPRHGFEVFNLIAEDFHQTDHLEQPKDQSSNNYNP